MDLEREVPEVDFEGSVCRLEQLAVRGPVRIFDIVISHPFSISSSHIVNEF